MKAELSTTVHEEIKTYTIDEVMPSHRELKPNLNRIEGQIRGISKMIDDGRYCLDILNQCRSIHAALYSVEKKIFRKFLKTCVRTAFREKNIEETELLSEQIVQLYDRN